MTGVVTPEVVVSTSPLPPPPANWRRPAVVFIIVLIVGGGGALFLLDRTSRDRRDGLEAAKAGDFKKAEPLLKRALEREPDEVEIVEALARGYIRERDPANAEAYLGKWVQLRPDAPEPRKLRMEFYQQAKKLEEAYPDAQKLLSLDPGNSQLRRTVMGLAFGLGEFASAEEHCRSLIRDFPKDDGLQVMLANVRRARGDPAEAATILDRVLKVNPTHGGALQVRAVLFEEANQPGDAIPLLREALRLDPSQYRKVGMRLAVMLERTGQSAEAEKVLAEVRRLQDVMTIEEGVLAQPDNLELRVRAGEQLLAAGHHADGVKMLLTVFNIDPTNRPAHRALAAHFEKIGQPDRAAQHRRAAEQR